MSNFNKFTQTDHATSETGREQKLLIKNQTEELDK